MRRSGNPAPYAFDALVFRSRCSARLLRVGALLYFANRAFVKDRLRGTLESRSDVTLIIFDMSGVNDVEALALSAIWPNGPAGR